MSLWRALSGPRFRQGAKVMLAALLAYSLANFHRGKTPEHELYAALGAAMVVGGSLGEDLKASLNRVRGTLTGMAAGISTALTLGMSLGSLAISVGSVAWLSLGLGWGPAAMRTGIAMALVVNFTHGNDAARYALARALYTILGVVVGLLVSRFVWPIRGRDEITAAIDRALTAIAAVLDAQAVGTAPDALRPKQVAVLDALTAIRTARQNASAERFVRFESELLTREVRMASRAALATLGLGIKLEELAPLEAPAACLQSLRALIASLAAQTKKATAAGGEEFERGYEATSSAASDPAVSALVRGLVYGALADLRQIHRSLETLHAAVQSGPRAEPYESRT
jgi:uncharacterized membrane protein YccC